MTNHQKFYQIVKATNSNKIVSSRCNERYFTRIGQKHLWEMMLEYSVVAADDLALSDRIWYFATGTPLQLCKTCNQKYTVVSRDSKELKPRIYCSSACQYNDPDLKDIIRERKKKVNQKQAQERRAATMVKKYGYTTNSQRPEIRENIGIKNSERQLSEEVLNLINDEDWIREQYVTQNKTALAIGRELGIDYSTILTRLDRFGIEIRPNGGDSYEERTLVEFIDSLGVEYVRNKRNIIGKEIDIFIPSLNLGIEYNGLFWHSEGNIDRGASPSCHQNKTNLCEENGISLLTINGDWWLNKPDIVKGMIRSKLGLNRKLYARNCKVKRITNKEANIFHNQNHIQGKAAHKISYAITHGDEIVQVASFGKPRFDKLHDWELIRLSTSIGITVVGGAGKLLKAFMSENEGSIVSYCDRQYSQGNVYSKLGFKEIRRTKPGYYWTDCTRLFHRSKFMKHNLRNILKNFDPNLSENQNMLNNRYRKYYDCGQIVFSRQK